MDGTTQAASVSFGRASSAVSEFWTSPVRAGTLLALSFLGAMLFGHDALSVALAGFHPAQSFWLLPDARGEALAALPFLAGVGLMLAPTVALGQVVWWLINHLTTPTPQAAVAPRSLTVWSGSVAHVIPWHRVAGVSFGPFSAVIEVTPHSAEAQRALDGGRMRYVLPVFLLDGGRGGLAAALARHMTGPRAASRVSGVRSEPA